MIKAGILDPLGHHGGFHYYTDGLAAGLSAAGVDVTLYGFDLKPRPNSLYTRISSFAKLYGGEPGWLRGLRYLKGVISAVVDARRRGISIIHLHCFHYDVREITAAFAIKLAGMRAVATLHDVNSFGEKGGEKGRGILLRLVDGVIAQNEFSARAIIQSDALPSAKEFTVVPHGNYVDDYPCPPSRSEAREALGLPKDRCIVLFFGNPRREKGLDILLEAVGILRDDNILALVAGKVKQDTLEELRAAEGGSLAGLIRVDAGHVSDADAERYYRAADMVVIPYRHIYESGVALMAMSLSRCVVYSDLEPLIDTVGEAGIPFKTEDAYDLALKLSAMALRPAAVDHYGDLGSARVRSTRGWSRVGELTGSFYRKVLGLPGAIE